jgi:hypothetical protein
MRETPVSGYIWFGTVLRFLQDAREGWLVHGKDHILSNLKAFLAELAVLELQTTLIVAEDEGLPQLVDELEDPNCKALSESQAKRISVTVGRIRKTLDAEAVQKKAFVASPKRGWGVDSLLQEPSTLFANHVFRRLNEVAAYDFQEACRCLAFERPTAAAFHMLRGTEAVLRDYYCSIVKQSRLQHGERMWHAMVEQMRSRRQPPPGELLDALDQIRLNYRNPTQHPEAIYDLDGAQDLMSLCISVINRMTKELPARAD